MENIKVGIILGSTREGRVSPQVGNWVLENVGNVEGVSFELIDIKDYNLPFLGASNDMGRFTDWQEKINSLDGFIFVAAEYNHSVTGALKNALDLLRDEWANKAAGIVSYGSAGGARSAEHLKAILTELQIATVRQQVLFSLFTDFKDYVNFAPQDMHKGNLDVLVTQLTNWARALKPIRK